MIWKNKIGDIKYEQESIRNMIYDIKRQVNENKQELESRYSP
jgi:hypothetical protein